MQSLSGDMFSMLPLRRILTHLRGSKMCWEWIFKVHLHASNTPLYAHRYHWSVGAHSAPGFYISALILVVTVWAPGKVIRAGTAQRTETHCSLVRCSRTPRFSLSGRTAGKSSPPLAVAALGVCIPLPVPLLRSAWGGCLVFFTKSWGNSAWSQVHP